MDFDRAAGLTMAHEAMKLKLKGNVSLTREVSERRQVGDAESMVNNPAAGGRGGDSRGDDGGAQKPWWRNVGMEDAL